MGNRSSQTRMFNGTTLNFGGAIGRLVGLRYKIDGTVVEVTEPDDLIRLYETGQADMEVTAKVKRLPTVTFGDTGTLTIVWKDGSTKPLPSRWIVTSDSGGGDENGVISGDITFKPTLGE